MNSQNRIVHLNSNGCVKQIATSENAGPCRARIIAQNIAVPRRKLIKHAMRQFEPRYDEHMHKTGHYALMEAIACRFASEGLIGDSIIDIGTGTGVTLGKIIRRTQLNGRILDVDARKKEGPIQIVALDFSKKMLRRAETRLRKRVNELVTEDAIELGLKNMSSRYIDLEIGKEGLICLKSGETELLVIRLVHADAVRLPAIVPDGSVSTAITSYCYHWFPGMEAKKDIAQKTYDALKEGGTFISIEEWPLVVTVYANNPATERLAKLISRVTTPIPMDQLHRIFAAAGFPMIPCASITLSIDEYHNMFGMVLQKPSTQ